MIAQVDADTAGARPEIVITTVDVEGESYTLVKLIGEIDLEVAPELRGGITKELKHGAISMVFDLAEATFIDSTTLGNIALAHKRMREKGGWMGVVCPDPTMARLFSITGLHRMFPVRDSFASLISTRRD
jgi:anti-sigma B factor antagonist